MDTLTASHICTSENQVSTNARCGHAAAAFSGTAKHTSEEDDVGVLLLISPDPRSAWRRRRRKGGGWRGGATPGRPTPRLRHPKMRAEAAPSEPPSVVHLLPLRLLHPRKVESRPKLAPKKGTANPLLKARGIPLKKARGIEIVGEQQQVRTRDVLEERRGELSEEKGENEGSSEKAAVREAG